jgi:hypothetical protein
VEVLLTHCNPSARLLSYLSLSLVVSWLRRLSLATTERNVNILIEGIAGEDIWQRANVFHQRCRWVLLVYLLAVGDRGEHKCKPKRVAPDLCRETHYGSCSDLCGVLDVA